MYMAAPGNRPALSKLANFIIFGSVWVKGGLDNILTSIVSNYDVGKRLGARDITICGSHVGSHVSENVNSY